MGMGTGGIGARAPRHIRLTHHAMNPLRSKETIRDKEAKVWVISMQHAVIGFPPVIETMGEIESMKTLGFLTTKYGIG